MRDSCPEQGHGLRWLLNPALGMLVPSSHSWQVVWHQCRTLTLSLTASYRLADRDLTSLNHLLWNIEIKWQGHTKLQLHQLESNRFYTKQCSVITITHQEELKKNLRMPCSTFRRQDAAWQLRDSSLAEGHCYNSRVPWKQNVHKFLEWDGSVQNAKPVAPQNPTSAWDSQITQNSAHLSETGKTLFTSTCPRKKDTRTAHRPGPWYFANPLIPLWSVERYNTSEFMGRRTCIKVKHHCGDWTTC